MKVCRRRVGSIGGRGQMLAFLNTQRCCYFSVYVEDGLALSSAEEGAMLSFHNYIPIRRTQYNHRITIKLW